MQEVYEIELIVPEWDRPRFYITNKDFFDRVGEGKDADDIEGFWDYIDEHSIYVKYPFIVLGKTHVRSL